MLSSSFQGPSITYLVRLEISRRSFLKASAPFAFGLGAIARGQMPIERGRFNRNHVLTGVEVYYEPWPSPPAIEWLRIPRSYGMPEMNERLLPRLLGLSSYPDGSNGTIEVDDTGRFRVRVPLSKKPGINTIMVWIRAGQTGTAFPASQICRRVE
jgi:hypothetical protein